MNIWSNEVGRNVRHVARMEDIRNIYKIWSKNLKVENYQEHVGIDEKMTSEKILEGSCEKGNEPSGSINGGKFFG